MDEERKHMHVLKCNFQSLKTNPINNFKFQGVQISLKSEMC